MKIYNKLYAWDKDLYILRLAFNYSEKKIYSWKLSNPVGSEPKSMSDPFLTLIHVCTVCMMYKCTVWCLFSDFVEFWTSMKFVSPKIIGNPIVTRIADRREMYIREKCFLEVSFLVHSQNLYIALDKGSLRYVPYIS